ncbi:unnamed protein product [Rhizopus stolonifer]
MLNGAWWIMIYELVITLGQTTMILSKSIEDYRITMMALLATSIPLLIIQIDYVIQYTRSFVPKGPATVYVAGYIVLVIMQYLWILIYGSKNTTFFGKLGKIRDTNEHAYYAEKIVPTSIIVEEMVDKNPMYYTEFPERVQAVHPYQADLEDPNELSFEKDEILEVAERKGNWWQARKHTGAVGIIPSNYFVAIDT